MLCDGSRLSCGDRVLQREIDSRTFMIPDVIFGHV